MKDRLFIRDYLVNYFDEIEPKDFYRAIFPEGELEEAEVKEIGSGKYNALAVELLPVKDQEEIKQYAKKYIVTDDLKALDELLKSENFIIISPISYIGKSRQSQNARFIYAMTIDLDGITEQHYLNDLFYQINEREFLPKPTYIVWSGSGVHLYYQFVKPLPCFKNVVSQLANLKRELTKRIWNGYITELAEKPQLESLFQGFRLVGGVTKGGNRTRAFEIGEKVTIDYLNEFVPEAFKMTEYAYKSKLTLKEAAAKYPEWHKKRVIENKPKGTWKAGEAVYNWWLRQLKEKVIVGHRYYAVMVLAIYAKKCGISQEQLEKDAYGLVSYLEGLTTEETNHFTNEDILAALEMFNDNYITFPIDSIVSLTAIPIEKNKRNYQKQEWHLEDARSKKANMKRRGQAFKNPEGRPSKEKEFNEWLRNNPEGTKKDCMAATGLSKTTVNKYWKIKEGN